MKLTKPQLKKLIEEEIKKQQISIFDINNVKEVVEYLKNNINAPFVRVQHSTLGGEHNVSILLVFSLDEKENWYNGILENSRYARFHIDRNGIVEQFTISHLLPIKFRKCRVKTYQDVAKKINEYIQKISMLKDESITEQQLKKIIKNEIKKQEVVSFIESRKKQTNILNEVLSEIPVNLEKITPEKLDKQLLRIAILAEIDAINLYEQMSDMTSNENIKTLLLDIAKEEKTHIGEFQALLLEIDKEQEEELEKGAEEYRELKK